MNLGCTQCSILGTRFQMPDPRCLILIILEFEIRILELRLSFWLLAIGYWKNRISDKWGLTSAERRVTSIPYLYLAPRLASRTGRRDH